MCCGEPQVLEKANLVDFHWHDTRHHFASKAVMAGVDLRTLQQLLGHKTLQMVVRYSHLSQSHELAAVEKLCTSKESPSVLSPENSDRDNSGSVGSLAEMADQRI